MNTSELALAEHLRALLAQGGTFTAQQLQAATGKSQPSISLALTKLGAVVCKLGAARSTRYALAQPILGLPAQQTLTWTTPDGRLQNFGSLHFLQGGQVYVRHQMDADSKKGADWLSPSGQLPWFLQSLRPQGFLGRQLTRLRPDFPADPDAWRVDQVLYMAINHAGDPPGALQVGETKRHFVAEAAGSAPDQAAHFDTLARAVTQTLPAASSAGGEQPKFLTESVTPDGRHQHLIVKFSPPRGTPFGERWHDLLHLEHLALAVLADHGVAVAPTHTVESNERTYLVSERFDRVGLQGKRHVVPAAAVHDAFVPSPRQHWVATCEALAAQKRLTQAQVDTVASTYLFGQYIGNTDMHFGNLSFFVDDVLQPALVPTPVYDMLPMLWRPGVYGGELDARPLQPPAQPTGYAALASLARAWAIHYWERAANLPTISAALRDASGENAQRLRRGFTG
ncbi:HipA domain-containing protein [Rhodoferax sp. AJA081-3]|uniref:HipA domain-containing protein n=1 Tax=Rhodoferax sp. AJA081-3 TaxID=2752316 RepID=UPI001ADF13AD|nr:HipA domain-containing protein [Rhodoferax sp. AJA081-3]QTN26257.1 HipA domain-containing protein [Rhodoferax sp. AJA081-3]